MTISNRIRNTFSMEEPRYNQTKRVTDDLRRDNNNTPSSFEARIRKKDRMKPIVCNNCGENGHIYRECTSPTTSYGIIVYYKDNNNILRYLEVNRKFSISFCEFVRGNYNTRGKGFKFSYLQHLIRNMTIKEKDLIRKEPFHRLWDIMCSNETDKPDRKRHFIYKRSRQKYMALKSGVSVTLVSGNTIKVTIKSILDRNITCYHRPEWGFPKGRKNKSETKLECALREFTEETSLDSKDIRVLFDKPITEEYKGSNGSIFCNHYFLAVLENPSTRNLSTQSSEYIEKNGTGIQNTEIGCVQWLDYYQAIDNIREYHHKTKDILYHVHHYLLSMHKMKSFISDPFGVPDIIPNTFMRILNPPIPLQLPRTG